MEYNYFNFDLSVNKWSASSFISDNGKINVLGRVNVVGDEKNPDTYLYKLKENGIKIQKTIPQYVTDAVAYDNGHMMIITVR